MNEDKDSSILQKYMMNEGKDSSMFQNNRNTNLERGFLEDPLLTYARFLIDHQYNKTKEQGTISDSRT